MSETLQMEEVCVSKSSRLFNNLKIKIRGLTDRNSNISLTLEFFRENTTFLVAIIDNLIVGNNNPIEIEVPFKPVGGIIKLKVVAEMEGKCCLEKVFDIES
ncbi:MAG: hypothetical protein NZ954_07295 [Thermofilaceae archaeon]|nr:hypothetical protein [Thermofilaceae archaeon]MCX8180597.1 hypothetical protein [Thermofilaceae archaeon]